MKILREPYSLMSEKREEGFKGTGEQMTDRSHCFCFFLSPNLFFIFTRVLSGRDRCDVVCQVQRSSESRLFPQDTVERNTPATFTHFSKTSFLPSLPSNSLSSVTNRRGGGFGASNIRGGGATRKERWHFKSFRVCPLP